MVQIHYLQLNWEVVQLVEHWSPKPAVVGSIPTFSAILAYPLCLIHSRKGNRLHVGSIPSASTILEYQSG